MCKEIIKPKELVIDLKDINNKETLQAGDKVYSVCMNKSVVLFNIGRNLWKMA